MLQYDSLRGGAEKEGGVNEGTIKSVRAESEYFRKDDEGLSKWGLQKKKSGVSKAKEGALERTGQTVSAKALGLKWAGCSQKTVKMPNTGEGKKQEGEVQGGKLNCTRLVDQVRPDHRAHGQRQLPRDLTDTLQGVLREWEP